MSEQHDDLHSIRERLRGSVIAIVPYCHPDWAWTHTRHWHEVRYMLVINEVLDILRRQEEEGVPPDAPHAFRWYADAWVTEMLPFVQALPERLEELRMRVRAGSIAICGGYANVRINHVPGETFVRAMVLGRREFQRLLPEADLSVHADIVDVAVGHPQTPQLLRLAGYQYLRFWRPHDALNARGIPHQFIWEGVDGSRVIAQRGSYGGVHLTDYAPEDMTERWDEVVRYWWRAQLAEKRDRTPVDLMVVYHGCDDGRPLRTHVAQDLPLDLPRLIREWNQREQSQMRFATPVEVFALLNQRRDELPVVKGTLDPCDVCYNVAWGGSKGLWRLREECAREIGAAEALDALTLAAGISELDPAQAQRETEDLWRDALLCSAHATQWLFQEDFDELHALATDTVCRARQRQGQRLKAIAARVAAPEDALALVYNPLPFERTVTVPLSISFVEGDRGGVPETMRLVDATGAELAWQLQRELGYAGVRWEIEALVQVPVPAGGWNTICWAPGTPAQAPSTPEPDVLDNGLLRVGFERGRLVSIADAHSGQTWTAPLATPFGHLRAYEVDATKPLHAGPVLGTTDALWERWQVTECGPVRWTMRAEGHIGPCPAVLEVRLYRGERRVELHVEVDWDGRDGFLAAHLPFPFAGEMFGDMPFCVEPKNLAAEPYVGIERQRRGMFIARSFVDRVGRDASIAWVSHDGDRYFLYDEHTDTLAHLLVNSVRTFYDDWEENVNSQMRGEGHHQFTCSIVPHEGDWRQAGLWRLADSLRTPPQSVWPLPGGDLPARHSLLSIGPQNVQMSACCLGEGRLLVRVFDSDGATTTARITLPFSPQSATRVDLNGNDMGDEGVSIEGSAVLVKLRPYEIATVGLA